MPGFRRNALKQRPMRRLQRALQEKSEAEAARAAEAERSRQAVAQAEQVQLEFDLYPPWKRQHREEQHRARDRGKRQRHRDCPA
jgi:hypothetical protein